MSKNKKNNSAIADIKRRYFIIIILSAFFVAFGVFAMLKLSFNPTPKYDDLIESRIVVDHIEYKERYGKFTSSWYYELKAANNEYYHLSGDFDITEIYKKLKSGSEIEIKWYSKTWLFEKIQYIEEIRCEDELLSVYTNDDKGAAIAGFVFGGISIVMGMCGAIIYRYVVNMELQMLPQKYQKKRKTIKEKR